MQGSFGRCRNGVLRDEFRHMPEEILLSEEVHESFSQGILPRRSQPLYQHRILTRCCSLRPPYRSVRQRREHSLRSSSYPAPRRYLRSLQRNMRGRFPSSWQSRIPREHTLSHKSPQKRRNVQPHPRSGYRL